MTPEQREEFCRAARLGIICGLAHRYEWLVNADRALFHQPYNEIHEGQNKLWDAFLAFEKGLASCPEEEGEYKNMTADDFLRRVNTFYADCAEKVGEHVDVNRLRQEYQQQYWCLSMLVIQQGGEAVAKAEESGRVGRLWFTPVEEGVHIKFIEEGPNG